MNTTAKVGAFGIGLSLAFGAALGVGHAVGPVGSGGSGGSGGHDTHAAPGSHTPAPAPAAAGAAPPAGLQVSERGYTLAPPAEPVPVGTGTDFRFRVLGPDGAPVTRFERAHDKELHLIVVRRDLSGFQHVHPTMAADGTWSVPLTFAAPGTYRVFADFTPSGDPAGGLTLGADVDAAGEFRPAALPAPQRTAVVDGYTVTLAGDLSAGAASMLTLSVSKDGAPVTDLEPYLGAFGHLVALRQGDLAYLHVHPQGEPGDGVTPAGPGVGFHTQAPSAGTYRLYLDFKHGGVVRTAEFTVTVPTGTAPAAPQAPAPQAPAPAAPAPAPAEGGHGGHAH